MENVVNIVNTRSNPLEFDITIQGVSDKDMAVKFVIETGQVEFGFACTAEEDNKWSVDIPPLPHLPHTSYNFHIEVIVDGYFFEPYRGSLNVTAEPEVKTTEVSKTRPTAPVVTPVVGKVTVKEDNPEKQAKKDEMDDLAEKFLKKKALEKKLTPPKSEEEIEKALLVKEAIASTSSKKKKKDAKKLDDEVAAKVDPIIEGGGQKAFEMGLDDGKKERPKKDAEASFGPYADEYYKGYSEGRDIADHEAWQEKVAAKRQGADYHESVEDKPTKTRKSNLAGAIKKLEEEPKLSEQAQKVHDIVKGK